MGWGDLVWLHGKTGADPGLHSLEGWKLRYDDEWQGRAGMGMRIDGYRELMVSM